MEGNKLGFINASETTVALKNVSPDGIRFGLMNASVEMVALKNVSVLARKLQTIVWSDTVAILGTRVRSAIVNLYQLTGFDIYKDDLRLTLMLVPISTLNNLQSYYER